jgi:mRNA-degrading endonuclease YafQ of YafQ-DinJ toxin-antitoxin module
MTCCAGSTPTRTERAAVVQEARRPPKPVRIESVAPIFKRRLKAKTPEQREQLQEAIRQMAEDLNHPSLRVRPIEGRRGLWEARASQSLRLSFEYVDSAVIRLRMNCTHDQVYGRRS